MPKLDTAAAKKGGSSSSQHVKKLDSSRGRGTKAKKVKQPKVKSSTALGAVTEDAEDAEEAVLDDDEAEEVEEAVAPAPVLAPAPAPLAEESEAGPSAMDAPKPAVHFVSLASEGEHEKARSAMEMEARSHQIASQIKQALEKASVRTVELFRDFDADASGSIDKKEFEKAMLGLGVKATKAELGDLFDRWDMDNSGSIDFKEMDRAIKGARMMLQRANTSAKEIQKYMRDKLNRKHDKEAGGAGMGRGGGIGAFARTRGNLNVGGGVAAEEPSAAKVDRGLPRNKAAGAKASAESEGEEQRWNAAQWLRSLSLHEVLADALELPEAGSAQYNYMRRLQRDKLEKMLAESDLISKFCDVVMEGVESLRGGGQGVQDGSVSSDKFQTNAKFQMSYGSLSLFYGGLESLLGPPKMYKARAHTQCPHLPLCTLNITRDPCARLSLSLCVCVCVCVLQVQGLAARGHGVGAHMPGGRQRLLHNVQRLNVDVAD